MSRMVSRIGAAVLFVATMTIGALSTQASPIGTPGGKGAPGPAPSAKPSGAPVSEGRGETGNAPAGSQLSQDAVARARMHECAHQWSSIKKAGNAGVTTWKEFSATCLVVSK